jgi:sulfur relay (sulfurtransferase) DsrF/TusC family protein
MIMAKILNIVETAYRATIEEQDDTVLWLTHMLKNAGAEISVLLRSNAVNYASKGQNASGLSFGDAAISHPPELDNDLVRMMEKGIPIFIVEEDITDRGLSDAELISGVRKIRREAVAELLDQYNQVWHW